VFHYPYNVRQKLINTVVEVLEVPFVPLSRSPLIVQTVKDIVIVIVILLAGGPDKQHNLAVQDIQKIGVHT